MSNIPPYAASASPCAACKTHLSRTCCELPKGETPTFGVTKAEVVRITAHTGQPASEHFEVDRLTPNEVAEFVRKSPVFADTFAGNKRIRLKVVPSEDGEACVFLKKGEGCSLPENIRPHACRLYPFWISDVVNKSGVPSFTLVNNLFPGPCYAQMVAKSGAHLFQMFNTTEKKLARIAQQMLADAKAHAHGE